MSDIVEEIIKDKDILLQNFDLLSNIITVLNKNFL